jgi:hypothetical protein
VLISFYNYMFEAGYLLMPAFLLKEFLKSIKK